MPYYVWRQESRFSALGADILETPAELITHLRDIKGWEDTEIAKAVTSLEESGYYDHHATERRPSRDWFSLASLQPRYENVSVTWRVADDAFVNKVRLEYDQHQARLAAARVEIDEWVRRESTSEKAKDD